MKRLILSTLVVIGLFSAWTASPAPSQAAMSNPAKVVQLKMALRDLYINHIFWVRSLVISTRTGEKAAISEADQYGLDNAKVMGRSLASFYGPLAEGPCVYLFANHYLDVKSYMRAAFANNFKGDETFKETAVDNLTRTADGVALFVSAATPNLPKSAVYALLTAHIGHHIVAINATAKKDWSAEADAWNPMAKQVYVLADTLADGIAKQFPEKFR